MKAVSKDLPDINQRLKDIIDIESDGNVRKFSINMGLSDSSKINRLFNTDKRSNGYPLPSIEIITLIMNKYGYSANWIINGYGSMKLDTLHTNNITINKKDTKGNNNIVSDGNVENGGNSELFEIIKNQQEQINNLLKMLNKNG